MGLLKRVTQIKFFYFLQKNKAMVCFFGYVIDESRVRVTSPGVAGDSNTLLMRHILWSLLLMTNIVAVD